MAIFATPPVVSRAQSLAFDKDVKPFLDTYCVKCHGPEKAKAQINFTLIRDASPVSTAQHLRTWQLVSRKLRSREMPPEDAKPQPADTKRSAVVDWIEQTIASLDYSKLPPDPGRKLIQRLTREEYNNTIRDLLGVTSRPADEFPKDGGGGKGFDNNAETLFVAPLLLEKYWEAAGQILAQADPGKLFTVRPDAKTPDKDAARRIFEDFATRAWRRPVDKKQIDPWVALFETHAKKGKSFEDAVRLVLRGILTSPQFLFRVEFDRPGNEPWPVDDYELASRLSYFLWSSMPDDTLFQLAAAKKLQDPAVIAEQVRRMIADPKSRALAENFGGAWLEIDRLGATARPDAAKFPSYTDTLRQAMMDEAVEFLWALFRENGSLTDLIDCNYAYVNEELAAHYGIPDVSGSELRKVPITDRNRGGVLGMAAVLTATSHPLRTSPVLRGRWVLGQLIGAPPPPPPPNVPSLPGDDKPVKGRSIRELLEAHRSKPECAACHRRIDPIGFGLENFDPIGRWRTDIAGAPIDTAGTLLSGETFNNPAELKKILMAKRNDFLHNLTENMFSYALGRALQPYDAVAVKKATEAAVRDQHRALTWITEIATSYPFRHRRNNPVSIQNVKGNP